MDYNNIRQSKTDQTNKVTDFKNPQKIGLHVTIALAASFIMIVIIAVNIFLILLSDKSEPFMPGLMGGMSIIPIIGISIAISLLRRPVRVLLDERGLTVEWLIRRRTFIWDEISEIQLKKEEGLQTTWYASFAGRKSVPKENLLLMDNNGRKLAQISESIKPFDVLVREIHNRTTAARGASTFSVDKQISREMLDRMKKRRLLLILGIPITLLGIAVGIMTYIEAHNDYLLEKDGQVIAADIVKHYIYNITPRMEYAFTMPDGKKYSNNVMVERQYWDALENSRTVPVKYLPANPKNNQLVSGQVADTDMPFPLIIVMSLLVSGIGFLCVCMYFLKIADIKIENGKFKIIRLNQVELSPTTTSLLDMEVYAEKTEEPESQIPEISEAVTASPAQPETFGKAAQRVLPGGLKAIGILNIVFGVLGTIWNLSRLLLVYMLTSNQISMAENVEMEQVDIVWVVAGHGIAGVIAVLLIISGIAILRFLNWGRILALVAVSAKLIVGIIEMVSVALSPIEAADTEQQFIAHIAKSFYVFLIILFMVYPAIVLILLWRKSTRELFKRQP